MLKSSTQGDCRILNERVGCALWRGEMRTVEAERQVVKAGHLSIWQVPVSEGCGARVTFLFFSTLISACTTWCNWCESAGGLALREGELLAYSPDRRRAWLPRTCFCIIVAAPSLAAVLHRLPSPIIVALALIDSRLRTWSIVGSASIGVTTVSGEEAPSASGAGSLVSGGEGGALGTFRLMSSGLGVAPRLPSSGLSVAISLAPSTGATCLWLWRRPGR